MWSFIIMPNIKNLEKSTTVSLLILLTAAVISVHAGSHRRHGHGLGCRHCGPGFAVLRPCGHGLDTECAACRPGQYQPHHSYRRHCLPCSRCGRSLFEAHACTAVRDAVCDSCHTLVAGPHSQDFYVKCANESIYSISPPPSESEEESGEEDDLWPQGGGAGVPGDVMLVRDELAHMRHDEDRPAPLEQPVRPHGVHSKLHSSKHAHLSVGGAGGGAGGSAATVVTAVVSICVLAGLLFAVVLSRWRTDESSKPHASPRLRNKQGYVVVSQSSSENSSPV